MNEMLFDYEPNETQEDENEWEDIDELEIPSETVNPSTSNISNGNHINLVICLMPDNPTRK